MRKRTLCGGDGRRHPIRSGTDWPLDECPIGRTGLFDDVITIEPSGWAVVAIRFVRIVRAAAEREVIHRSRATRGVRTLGMVVLEVSPLVTAPALIRHERATTAGPVPHLALNCRRDVAGVLGLTATLPRTLRGRELLAGEIPDQECQRAVEDLGHVSAGNRICEQIPNEAQLLVAAPAGGEADLVAVRRKGPGQEAAA
jgi:hypothetical protein